MKRSRIPKNTRQYILDTLQFAPVPKRELDRHMHRRSDYAIVLFNLQHIENLVLIRGTGTKGNKQMVYLKSGDRAGDAFKPLRTSTI